MAYKGRLVQELIKESRIYDSFDVQPSESEIGEILSASGQNVDLTLHHLISQCCSMMDEYKSIEFLPTDPPRPPAWYWDLFCAADLILFGSRSLEGTDKITAEPGLLDFIQKDAGMCIIEAAWDSEYAKLFAEGIHPADSFLDYRADFDQNWPKLLLLLYHICCGLHEVRTVSKSGIAENELFAAMLKKACYFELGVDAWMPTDASRLAKSIRRHEIEMDAGLEFIETRTQSHTHARAASESEASAHCMQEARGAEERDVFHRIRGIFPSTDDLGEFASDAISDDSIRAVLAVYGYDFQSAVFHLQRELAEKDTPNANPKAKPISQGETWVSTLRAPKKTPSSSEAFATSRPRPRPTASAKATESDSESDSEGVAINIDFDCCVVCCRRMLALDMNALTQPKIVCDRRRGLILKGWGTAPESGSALGSPFSRGIDVRRLDLHQVHLKEALQLVASIISLYTRSQVGNRAGARIEIGLLVGKGIHSSRTGPRLGPNIAALLRRQHVRYREEEAWLILSGYAYQR